MALPPVLEPDHLILTLPLFGIFLWIGRVVYHLDLFGSRIGAILAIVGSGLVSFSVYRLAQLNAFGLIQDSFIWTGYDWQVEMAMLGVFLGIAGIATGLALVGAN